MDILSIINMINKKTNLFDIKVNVNANISIPMILQSMLN